MQAAEACSKGLVLSPSLPDASTAQADALPGPESSGGSRATQAGSDTHAALTWQRAVALEQLERYQDSLQDLLWLRSHSRDFRKQVCTWLVLQSHAL